MRNGLLGLAATVVAGASPILAQPAQPAPKAAPPAALPPAAAVPAPAPAPGVLPPPPGLADCGTSPCTTLLGGCEDACRCEKFWLRGEYLMWWMRGSAVPPLVTTGLAAGVCPGALNRPDTVILFGGNEINNGLTHGGRFTAGTWLGRRGVWGVEGSYLFLGPKVTNFFTASSGLAGSPIIARPFTTPAGVACSEVVAVPAGAFAAFPGGIGGDVTVRQSTFLQGFEATAVRRLGDNRNLRLEAIGGFRYLELREQLTIVENLRVGVSPTPLANSVINVVDSFRTDNDFYGAQVGARGEYRRGRLFLNAAAKVALGVTHQDVQIAGTTRITPIGGAATVVPGGLLALTTNNGRYTRDRFGVIPEANINVGYQLTDSLRAFVGYTFLYWNGVARPGDQIDLTVNPFYVPTNLNPAVVPAPARPAFVFRERDFWVQGINFGLEFRY